MIVLLFIFWRTSMLLFPSWLHHCAFLPTMSHPGFQFLTSLPTFVVFGLISCCLGLQLSTLITPCPMVIRASSPWDRALIHALHPITSGPKQCLAQEAFSNCRVEWRANEAIGQLYHDACSDDRSMKEIQWLPRHCFHFQCVYPILEKGLKESWPGDSHKASQAARTRRKTPWYRV